MGSENRHELTKTRRTAIAYNQAINFFWSILNLLPISYFSAVEMNRNELYIFLIGSFVSVFLPNSFFDFIQLGKTPSIYHKLGIRTVKKFTQDGDLVNGLLRKKFPHYQLVKNTVPLKIHIRKAYINEKFHFMVLVFFLLTSAYALLQGFWWWALILQINNLIYNVYPIFLQQYNRIRLRKLMSR